MGATYSNRSGWVCVSQSRFTWGETAGNLFGGVGEKVCLCRVAHLQSVCGLNTRVYTDVKTLHYLYSGHCCSSGEYRHACVCVCLQGDWDANIPHGASIC